MTNDGVEVERQLMRDSIFSSNVRQQPGVSMACLEGQDFHEQPAGFAFLVTEARIVPQPPNPWEDWTRKADAGEFASGASPPEQLVSHDVRQQPGVSLACLEGQDFPGQPAGFALMVTEARVAPVRVGAAECCPSLQTRVSKMFHNYRFNETSIVTEAAEGAGWVGAITLKYIGLLHIPTVAQVCRDANNAVKIPWQYARHQPRDGLTLMNDRCSLCGWFTSAQSADDESLCCECANTGICSACSYVATDGRTLCGECDLEDGAPDNLRSIIKFFDSSEVHNALDYFQSCGDHSIAKMTTKRMPAMMLYILIEWRRTCVKHVMDAWNVL